MKLVSWRELITKALSTRKESWEEVEACTLSDAELDEKFDRGYGGVEGKPFTVWTYWSVYFPACYDGGEWVEGVSRNPDGKPTYHIGGG